MGQYREGTVADGPNGPIIYRGGRWVPAGGQSPQATAIPLPVSERTMREDQRKDAAEGRDVARTGYDQIKTGIAVTSEDRAGRNERFDNAKNLRDEFNKLPDVQDYRQAIKAYATALKTSETAAGDLNLIYAFAKIMDPNSVVREGEQAAVGGGDSVYGQTIARLKKELGDGGAFRPEYRNQLRAELQNRVAELNTAYEGQRQQYQSFAKELGVEPQVVLGQHDGSRFRDDIVDYWRKQNTATVQSGMDANGAPLPNGARLQDGRNDTAFTKGLGYRDSYAGQGMSGINEGIGNALGSPVDLMTAGMNMIPRGINAVANTNLPTIQNPALGSQWMKDRMAGWGIYGQSNDPSKQFARRVGQSVGSAVPFTGAAGSMRAAGMGLLGAAGGGVGGAAAQQAFPDNPMAEFTGEMLGSGLTTGGLMKAGQGMAQRRIEGAIPTVPQLKEQAGNLYRQAESRGITSSPQMTQDLAANLRDVLQREGRVSPTGRISEVYPKIKEAMQLADDYAGNPMNPTQIQTMRSVMGDGLMSKEPSERRLSSMMTDTFDAWANPQAPELAQARNIASRYLNAQQLEQARELASSRASQFSNSGMENALRTEYRNLDRQGIKGGKRYSQTLTDAIENVSRGTPGSNFARGLGRFAPTGVVSAGLGTGGPAALGTMMGGPGVGLAAGATAATLGTGGRLAAEAMTRRNAEIAELIARNGGPIQQAPLIDDASQRAIQAVLSSQAATYASPLASAPRKPRKKQR